MLTKCCCGAGINFVGFLVGMGSFFKLNAHSLQHACC